MSFGAVSGTAVLHEEILAVSGRQYLCRRSSVRDDPGQSQVTVNQASAAALEFRDPVA